LASRSAAVQQRDALLAFIAKMESLPDPEDANAFSNRDHDQAIYGTALLSREAAIVNSHGREPLGG